MSTRVRRRPVDGGSALIEFIALGVGILVPLAYVALAAAAVQSGVAPARLAELPIVRQLQRLGEEFGEGDLRKLAQLPHQLDYEFDSLHTVAADVR